MANSIAGRLLMGSIVGLPTGFAAQPAAAQDTFSIAIRGDVAETCSVDVPSDQTIDPASSQPQEIGVASFSCNFSGSPSVTFWSTNGGKLVAPASSSNGGAAQSLVYQFSYNGQSVGQLTNSADSAKSITAQSVPGTTQSGAAIIQIGAPATVAGSYADTIYLRVAP